MKHAVAAIGATHEYELRKKVNRDSLETESLHPFALRQCNKAIKSLVRPTKHTSTNDLARALCACILFACFESMNGNRKAAVPHIVYARRLTQQLKQTNHRFRGGQHQRSFPISLENVEPIMTHHESQMGDAGDDNDPSGHLHDFDVEGPVTINRVTDARISLEQAITSVSMVSYTLVQHHQPDDITAVAEKKAAHRAWYERWDAAFTAFLARERSNGMDQDTLDGCRALKMHQLAGYVFASVEYGKGEEQWATFTPQYQAITDLATEILHHRPKPGLASFPPQTPYINPTVGLTEPLYVAAARCADPVIAEKARMLLNRLPHYEGAYSSWRMSFLEASLCIATGKAYDKGVQKQAG